MPADPAKRDPRRRGTARADGSRRPGSRNRTPAPRRDSPADAPPIPADVTGAELDPPVREALQTLPRPVAAEVARRLVAAGQLLDEEPVTAYQHARAARRMAPRVAYVREAAGLTAYAAGEFGEALAELRTLQRMAGASQHLPVVADCERALGRPARAIRLADDPAARALPTAEQVELWIVVAGARRDLGQPEAAVAVLDGPWLHHSGSPEWVPRVRYAYADALLAAGRADEASTWFARAAAADPDHLTDAADRVAALRPPEPV